MGKMLMGAFATPGEADKALRELEARGYKPEEISAISSSDKYADKGYSGTGSNVAASAGSGAVTGGVIGGLAGLLAGVGVIPAVAGFFIGGPIAAAIGLAGAAAVTASGAVTGAAAGGLIGALTGLGVPKETATSYDSTVKEGGVVLGLAGHEDITAEARDILERCGARDINVIEMHGESAAPAASERMSNDAQEREEIAMRSDSPRQSAARPQPAFGETRESGARVDEPRREAAGRDDVGRQEVRRDGTIREETPRREDV